MRVLTELLAALPVQRHSDAGYQRRTGAPCARRRGAFPACCWFGAGAAGAPVDGRDQLRFLGGRRRGAHHVIHIHTVRPARNQHSEMAMATAST